MNAKPLGRITESDLRRYDDDGVICLRGMFDREWIERMGVALERIMNTPHPEARAREVTRALGGKTGRFHINTFVWRWDPDFRDWAIRSPCAEIAAVFMRARTVRLFYDQVFVKEPDTREVTDWHHDLPFWPVRGNQIASVWVPLTPVTSENSALEYIAGSHCWGKFYRAAVPDKDPAFNSDLEECPDFSARRGDPALRFLSWELQPGDCLVHQPLTVHGAPGNFSPTRRRAAISTRYFGPDARWDPRPATMKIPGNPKCVAGEPPCDDDVFPVVWHEAAGAA